MLKVKRLVVGQLKTNCYLVIDEESRQCLIIDPGDDADYIMRIISDEGVKPKLIAATHGHYDHILAVTELQLGYSIPFLMHKADEFLLSRMSSSAYHFGKITTDHYPNMDEYLKNKEKLDIGHLSFEIIHSPGHTPGSVTLFAKKQNLAFVGDLIFANGGVGRTDFLYSDKEELSNSIKRVLQLPDETVIYPGHGEETTIATEKHFFQI